MNKNIYKIFLITILFSLGSAKNCPNQLTICNPEQEICNLPSDDPKNSPGTCEYDSQAMNCAQYNNTLYACGVLAFSSDKEPRQKYDSQSFTKQFCAKQGSSCIFSPFVKGEKLVKTFCSNFKSQTDCKNASLPTYPDNPDTTGICNWVTTN